MKVIEKSDTYILTDTTLSFSKARMAVMAKFKLKDYKGSAADCDKAITLNNSYAAAYLNRGIAREMLRQQDKACEDWNKAASLGLKNGKTFSQQSCN